MNKHQKAIKSVVKNLDMIFISNNFKMPSNYATRRKHIKIILKERGILSTEDILLTSNNLKLLFNQDI